MADSTYNSIPIHVLLLSSQLSLVTNKMQHWKHGLWNCFDNFNMLVVSLVCPCYQFGKNAARLGENNIACCVAMFIPGILPCSAAHLRSKLREKNNIKGSYGKDLATWIFCPFCALVQETQELEDNGQPPSLEINRN